jgi:2-alkenal reductase
MPERRIFRLLIGIAAIVLLLYLLQPTLRGYFFSASTPREVQPRGALADFERTAIELFDRTSPSVVQVVVVRQQIDPSTFMNRDGADMSPQAVSAGTGFVWDRAGNVVTNAHVVGEARRVVVRTATGDTMQADVIGTAPNYDLAVVRIVSRGSIPAAVAIGASADLKVGQWVFAVGNPFGLDQTLTTGVISALKRRIPTTTGREISDVIQTDAAINPGNSGGPLLDSAGRLIGVTTAIVSPSGTNAGVGFAIPVDTVNRVVPQLIRAGRAPTPGIGIIAASEALAAQAGVEGVVIVRTVPGSPAERAGLHGVDANTGRLGDVITSVDGQPVRKLSDLTRALEKLQMPGKVQLGVVRGGAERKVSIDVVDIGER